LFVKPEIAALFFFFLGAMSNLPNLKTGDSHERKKAGYNPKITMTIDLKIIISYTAQGYW
jgi:hypothetical protein